MGDIKYISTAEQLLLAKIQALEADIEKFKAQPVQSKTGNLVMDSYHAMQTMKVEVQPVQPAPIDAEFPELPRPDRNAWPHGFHDLYTAQQMRDYTQQATAPILAKLATQVALVEKCMVAMNENADRGEKAEAEVGRLVRKLALEREEFKAELDKLKAQRVQPALTDDQIAALLPYSWPWGREFARAIEAAVRTGGAG